MNALSRYRFRRPNPARGGLPCREAQLARDNRRAVLSWGRLPPPYGGVTRSIEVLHQDLIARGIPAFVMDPSKHRALIPAAAALSRREVTLSLFHTSKAERIQTSEKIAHRFTHPRVLYLHGGSLIPELREADAHHRRVFRDSFANFREIWATNDALEAAIREMSPVPTKVVSPFSERARTTRQHSTHGTPGLLRLLVAAYRGDELYCVDLAVEVCERLRSAGCACSLVVLLYGGLSDFGASLLERLSRRDWVRVARELSAEQVDLQLDGVDVLLRPTLTDGDSLIVREALAKGIRVIGSNVVPRPHGVELAELSSGSFVEAITTRGQVSEGLGLGTPVNREVLRLLSEGLP
jgi:glycogen synthase